MENIKLVIWDLDETFWSGTLSEGEITPIQSNIELVKKLTDRGIINSISSKNDFDSAKQKLIDLQIWDYFVFPCIAWTPKGECVADIINNCQLRAANVLFVDDNVQNLREVEFYNKGITAVLPDKLNFEIGNINNIGKDDRNHSRLKQYKILEEKADFQKNFSDNIMFLQQSEITLSIIENLDGYRDRILELISRTNQLNFTKVRSSNDEIEEILNNPKYKCACIHVSDRFGDYGICGFYALDTRCNKLVHFLFSCRILNLNIENYIYNKLGKPTLEIVGPVSANLYNNINVTWIKEVDRLAEDDKIINKQKKKILFVGGCDLEQMCHYIPNDKYECIKDFNFPNDRGVAVHKEHTIYLKEVESLTNVQKDEIIKLPFGHPQMFSNKLFEDSYDILVFSVLMNYTHEVYSNNNSKFKVAYGGYLSMKQLVDYLGMTKDEADLFMKSYKYEGLQSPADFIQDLEWLLKRINKPIIFINGAEIRDVCTKEPNAYDRHCEMNKALDKFVSEHPSCSLIDVRQYVKERKDVKDTIRHYQRTVYLKLAEDLLLLINENSICIDFKNRIIQRVKLLKIKIVDFLRNVKLTLRNIFKSFSKYSCVFILNHIVASIKNLVK